MKQGLTNHDLISAGYQPGPAFKELLALIADYEGRGITDKKYQLKLLKRDFSPPPPKAVMREKALRCAEALLGPRHRPEVVALSLYRRHNRCVDGNLKASWVGREGGKRESSVFQTDTRPAAY